MVRRVNLTIPISLSRGLIYTYTINQLYLDILILIIVEVTSRQIGFVKGTIVGACEGDIAIRS